MRPEIILIVLGAEALLAAVIIVLFWWYLPPVDLPGPDSMPAPRAGEFHTEDDEWADQLHAINQLGKFGDLTRPVAHLTYYEVEALIRTLAVPEWVPDRYRMAA